MLDAIASMPRAMSEVHRMEEVLKNLDEELARLSEQIATFDTKNATGIEELSRLDTLKSNIETCKGTLEEHARWNQVVRESWALLESGGHLSETADRYCSQCIYFL
jgi:DNA repair exonuclease SbcCD ATPase subunit